MVYSQKDCKDAEILVSTVISSSESIFLRWEIDSLCSYSYEVTWKTQNISEEVEVGYLNLETDDSKLNATKLTPNTKYVFYVSANKTLNASFPIYTAPAEVRNINATDITRNSVTLVWDSPVDGAGNASWAEVCVSMYDNKTQCDYIDGNEFKLTGLSSCTNHTITVTSIGFESDITHEDLRSETTTVYYSTLKGVPGKVTDLNVFANDYNTLMVTWKLPTWYDAPNCVTSYNVTVYNVHNDSESKMFTVNRTFLYSKDLKPCTSYNASVISIGDEGSYDAVTAGPTKTAPLPIPEGSIVVNESTPTWVEITWGPPSYGNECLSYYTLIGVQIDDSKEEPTVLTNKTTHEELKYRYTGFQPCESRAISIFTVNDEGVGSMDTTEILHSTGVDPGNVTDLVVNRNDGFSHFTAEMSWKRPNTTSKCARYYQVCIEKVNSFETPTCEYSVTGYSYDSDFLDACTEYSFSVTIWGPFGMEFGTTKMTKLFPYIYTNVIRNITAKDAGSDTFVTWNLVPYFGTDCIEFFTVCWITGSSNSSCTNVSPYSSSTFIPEKLDNLREVHLKAYFYDKEVSDEIVYYGKGTSTNLQLSLILITCGLFLQLIFAKDNCT